jgi:subtilisin family serine protease
MKQRTGTNIFSLTVLVVVATFVLASLPTPLRVSGVWDLAGVASAQTGVSYEEGTVVVQLKKKNANQVARRHNMTVLEDLGDNFYLFGINNARTVEQAVDELEADTQNVISAEPNYLLVVPEVDARKLQRSIGHVDGDAAAYADQYALDLIQAADAQAIADGSNVIVAVVDTGVDTTHPAFARVVQGYDWADHDSDPSETGFGDAYGHGTMVAGVIVLVAPQAIIMPVRAFDSEGVGKASDVSNAIRYAARQGAVIINMSFGLPVVSAPIQAAINFASRRGVVLIASAGNNNTSLPPFPASDPQVMAVAATDSADLKASFSNYGSYISVSAPGVDIHSAYPGGTYATWEGTSFAAPFVSGEAALVVSQAGGNARQTIQSTAVNIDALNPNYSGLLGSGRIDCLAAVSQ